MRASVKVFMHALLSIVKVATLVIVVAWICIAAIFWASYVYVNRTGRT